MNTTNFFNTAEQNKHEVGTNGTGFCIFITIIMVMTILVQHL